LALALGVTFMLVNLALELSYRYLDPRLRELR
jgi:ABC-type dipeptide/oligopeptide/nickel transport system permease component